MTDPCLGLLWRYLQLCFFMVSLQPLIMAPDQRGCSRACGACTAASADAEDGHGRRCRSSRKVDPAAGPSFTQGCRSGQAAQGGPADDQGALAMVLRRGPAQACILAVVPRHSVMGRSRVLYEDLPGNSHDMMWHGFSALRVAVLIVH